MDRHRQGRRRRPQRMLRVALALGATIAATAAVGYGGLAAWQAYTDNPDSVAAQSLGHTNTASGLTCTSVTSAGQLNRSGNTCSDVISIGQGSGAVSPSSPSTLATGTVAIASTGLLPSTFELSMLNPPAVSPTPGGNLCADMILTVSDATTTYWSQPASTQIVASSNVGLDDSAGAATWPGTSPGPVGHNTFTVTLTKGPTFNTDSQDEGNVCSFDLLFTQQSA